MMKRRNYSVICTDCRRAVRLNYAVKIDGGYRCIDCNRKAVANCTCSGDYPWHDSDCPASAHNVRPDAPGENA